MPEIEMKNTALERRIEALFQEHSTELPLSLKKALVGLIGVEVKNSKNSTLSDVVREFKLWTGPEVKR